jgi:general secretion pathway protein M
MKEWFERLTARDQVAVLMLAVFLAIFILLKSIVLPLNQEQELLRQNNQDVAAALARVDAKASQLIALRAGETGVQRNISSLITDASEVQGLQVQRLQPNSRGEAQVRFEGVDFDRLLKWFDQIEYDDNLVVIDVALSQGGRLGGVNATVRVAQGG